MLVLVLVSSAAKVQQHCNLKRLKVTRMEFITPMWLGKVALRTPFRFLNCNPSAANRGTTSVGNTGTVRES